MARDPRTDPRPGDVLGIPTLFFGNIEPLTIVSVSRCGGNIGRRINLVTFDYFGERSMELGSILSRTWAKTATVIRNGDPQNG